jgi:hypothetical protein
MYDALVLALPNDKEAPQVFFTEPHQKNTWLRERWEGGGSFRVESGYYAVIYGVIWDEMGFNTILYIYRYRYVYGGFMWA